MIFPQSRKATFNAKLNWAHDSFIHKIFRSATNEIQLTCNHQPHKQSSNWTKLVIQRICP